MTTDAGRRVDVVDQVMFGFRTMSGRGMGVVASSYPPRSDQPDRWHELLRAHYRLFPGSDTSSFPKDALSYLEFRDGRAAVLRRSGSGESIGRNFSHALIGQARSLSGLSLYLDDWTSWCDQEPAGSLETIGLTDLVDQRSRSLARLDLAALDVAPEAVPLIRAVLADPGGRFSALGAAPDAVLPMIRLMRRVVGPVLDGAAPAFPWTFSSFEADDNPHRPDLPALLFLPDPPRGVPASPGRPRRAARPGRSRHAPGPCPRRRLRA